MTNKFTENQDKSPDCEVCTPRRQLQLQSHRSFYAFNDLLDLQRNQGSSPTKQPSRLGRYNENLATKGSVGNILRIFGSLYFDILELLERRT